MKRFFTFFMILLLGGFAYGQTVDLQLMGFLNENDQVVYDIVLTSDEDFQPRMQLKNNGPDVPAAGDSIIFDVEYNFAPLTQIVVMGSAFQNVVAGQTCTITLTQPMMTASYMDELQIVDFRMCYQVRIVGAAHDPDTTNNTACAQVDRPILVPEFEQAAWRVYPNPTTGVVRVASGNDVAEPVVCTVYDLYGKMLLSNQLDASQSTLDLSALAKGMYIVRVSQNGNIVANEKVMKL